MASSGRSNCSSLCFFVVCSDAGTLKFLCPCVLVGWTRYRPPINVSEDVAEQEDVVMAASGSLCGSRIDLIAASEIVVLIRKLLDPTASPPGTPENHAAQWAAAINDALQEALCKPITSSHRHRQEWSDGSTTPRNVSPAAAMAGATPSPRDTSDLESPYSAGSRRRRRSSSFVPRSENRRQATSVVGGEAYSSTDLEHDSRVVQRIWRLLGALCVLGGDTEVLRDQCKVRLFLPSGVKKPARVFRYNAWTAAVALGAEDAQSGAHGSSAAGGGKARSAGEEKSEGAQNDHHISDWTPHHYNYNFDRDTENAVTINLEDVQIEVVQQVPVPIEHVHSKGNLLFSIHQLLLGTHPVQSAAPLSHSSSSDLSTSFTAVSQLFLQQTRMRSCKALGYLLHDEECLTTAIDNGYIDILTKITQHENPQALSLRSQVGGDSAASRASTKMASAGGSNGDTNVVVDPVAAAVGMGMGASDTGVGSRGNEYALEHRWIELQHQRNQLFQPLARLALGTSTGSMRSYHLRVRLAEVVGMQLFDTQSTQPHVFFSASVFNSMSSSRGFGGPHSGVGVGAGLAQLGSRSPMPITVKTQFTVPVPVQPGRCTSVSISGTHGDLNFLVADVTSAVLCIDAWARSCDAGDGVSDEEEKRQCRTGAAAVPVKCQFLGQVVVPVYQVLLSDVDAQARPTASASSPRGSDGSNTSQPVIYRFPLGIARGSVGAGAGGGATASAKQHGAVGLGISVSVPTARDAESIRQAMLDRKHRLLPLSRPMPPHLAEMANPRTASPLVETATNSDATVAAAAEAAALAVEAGCFEKIDFIGLSIDGVCVIPPHAAEWVDGWLPDHDGDADDLSTGRGDSLRKVLGFAQDAAPEDCRITYTHGLDFQNQHADVLKGSTSAYLNRYTVILDVWFSSDAISGADDGDPRYLSLLQTSFCGGQVDTPGSWFVRSDGVPGCCVYGLSEHDGSNSDNEDTNAPAQPRVAPEQWHRLVLTVDTVRGCVRFFVDGELATELVDPAQVLVDDRWSLDKTFALFHDGDSAESCPGSLVRVGSFQLRDYPMPRSAVVRLGGASTWGIPPPSKSEAATALCMLLNQRFGIASCASALRAVNYRRVDAIVWLRANQERLAHNERIHTAALASGLGLAPDTVASAIAAAHGDIIDGILHLMETPPPDDDDEDSGRDGRSHGGGGGGEGGYSLQTIQGRGDTRSDMYRLQSGTRATARGMLAEAEAAAAASLGGTPGSTQNGVGGLMWRTGYNMFDVYDYHNMQRAESLGGGGGAKTFHLRGGAANGAVGAWMGDAESTMAVNALANAVLRCTRQLVHSLAASAVMRMVINGSRRKVLSPFRAQLRRLLLDNRTAVVRPLPSSPRHKGKEAKAKESPAKAAAPSATANNGENGEVVDGQEIRSRFLYNFLNFLSDTLVRDSSGIVGPRNVSNIRIDGSRDEAGDATTMFYANNNGSDNESVPGGNAVRGRETTASPAMAVAALETILKQELLLATDPHVTEAAKITAAVPSLEDALGGLSPPKSRSSSGGGGAKSPGGTLKRTPSFFRGSADDARKVMAESRLLTNVLASEAILSMVSSFTMSSSIVAYPVTAWRCVWSGLGPKAASIWNPVPPPRHLLGRAPEASGGSSSKNKAGDDHQWVLLGDVASVGSAPPGSNSSSSAYAFYGAPGAFARPSSFERVWSSTNWDCNFALWRMVAPPGYVSVGCVATLHGTPPSGANGERTPYRCIREDLVHGVAPTEVLWRVPTSVNDSQSHVVFTAGNLASTFVVGAGTRDSGDSSSASPAAYHLATQPVLFNRHSESIAVWLLQLLISASQARTTQLQSIQLQSPGTSPRSPTANAATIAASLDAPVLLSPHLVRTLWATAERALGAQDQRSSNEDVSGGATGGANGSTEGGGASGEALQQVSGLGLFRYKWLRLLSSVLRLSSHTNEQWGKRITDRYEDELDELFMTIADEQLRNRAHNKDEAAADVDESTLPEGAINGNFAWSSYVQTILELVVGTRIRSMEKSDLDHVKEAHYAVSNKEDWLATAYWLQKHIECALVMQSLVDRHAGSDSAHPTRRKRLSATNTGPLSPARIKAATRLPASFLAGADAFAPYFGVCEAQVIESAHPYVV